MDWDIAAVEGRCLQVGNIGLFSGRTDVRMIPLRQSEHSCFHEEHCDIKQSQPSHLKHSVQDATTAEYQVASAET